MPLNTAFLQAQEEISGGAGQKNTMRKENIRLAHRVFSVFYGKMEC